MLKDLKVENTHLADLRKSKGFTQKHLAEKLGTDSAYISRLERGQHKLTVVMAQRYEEVFDISAATLLEGDSGLRRSSQDSVDLLTTYDDLLPLSAHEAIRTYIDHILSFYTAQTNYEDPEEINNGALNRTRDGWSWGLRHLGRVLNLKCVQVGIPIARLNIHRARKVRIGTDFYWQTQMYVTGQSGAVNQTETYSGGASPVITQMAKAVDYTDGVYPSSIFEKIPHFSWNYTENVMFIFLRNTRETFICLQFSGFYDNDQYLLARGIAEEYMEEFGGSDFSYRGQPNGPPY